MGKVCPGGSWVSTHTTQSLSLVPAFCRHNKPCVCVCVCAYDREKERRKERVTMHPCAPLGMCKGFVHVCGVLDIDKSLCCWACPLWCTAPSGSQACAVNTRSAWLCRCVRVRLVTILLSPLFIFSSPLLSPSSSQCLPLTLPHTLPPIYQLPLCSHSSELRLASGGMSCSCSRLLTPTLTFHLWVTPDDPEQEQLLLLCDDMLH